MKKLYSFFLTLCMAVGLQAQDVFNTVNPAELVAEAAFAYEQGDYAKASATYESLSHVFSGSPDIYYSLGNAYYKQKLFAKAILNYERCLKRDPAHVDAKANLEMAKLQCVDKIESIQPIIFVTWNNAVRNLLSTDGWSRLSIALFLLFLSGLACFFFLRRPLWRKIGFYGGICMLLVCIVTMAYAHAQAERQLAADQAIVMAPTVTLRSSPADSGNQLLVIHEGLKVRIRQELSGWSEVELSDGSIGWMPTAQLEVI